MTAPATTQAPPAAAAGKQAPLMRPFLAGTRDIDRVVYDQTVTTNASTQDLPILNMDPNGFLAGAYLIVTGTTSGNSANTTFAADGPFNVIDSIEFRDIASKPMFGPMNGHDFYTICKYGGYVFSSDVKQNPTSYSTTTGTGGTGGSFAFILRLPVEIVRREQLGSLTNKSSAATFDLAIRIAATATIYGTGPTAAPSVRVQVQEFGWMDPSGHDIKGNAVQSNPPGIGTTQYWRKQPYNGLTGDFNQPIKGINGMLRGILWELRDSNASRTQGDADWPTKTTINYETAVPVSRLDSVWKHMIAERYGYTAAVETAGGRDYGVRPWMHIHDFSNGPGAESRLGYYPMSSDTTMSIEGTIGGSGAHKLTAFANVIVPAGGNPMVLTGR